MFVSNSFNSFLLIFAIAWYSFVGIMIESNKHCVNIQSLYFTTVDPAEFLGTFRFVAIFVDFAIICQNKRNVSIT